jgi:hypothetical protein
MPALWVVPEELEEASASPYAYEACKTASYVLWSFSGRKFHGTRTVTERYECPCRSFSDFKVYPYMNGDGQIYNALFPTDPAYGCNCTDTVAGRHVRLRLRGTPVRQVQKVVKNGETLDPSQYKIVNGSMLQLTGTSLDVCGLEITYTYGVNVPTAGRRAARLMAAELCKGWGGDETCMLPDRVTNVNRQGFSFTIMDPQDFLEEGRTGLYEVDLFLRAANPDKARKPARVFSPDLPKAFRVTAGQTSQILGPYDWQITPGEAATWSVNLTEANADILLDADWNPQAQISSWNGAVLFEFDNTRFTIASGILTVNLTATETSAIAGSTAAWDLYAINATDGYTLVHVLSSTIHMTGDV